MKIILKFIFSPADKGISREQGWIRKSQKLTAEEIAHYKEVFMIFDRNNDGQITSREIGDVMRSLGQNPTDVQLQVAVCQVAAHFQISQVSLFVSLEKAITYMLFVVAFFFKNIFLPLLIGKNPHICILFGNLFSFIHFMFSQY